MKTEKNENVNDQLNIFGSNSVPEKSLISSKEIEKNLKMGK